MTERAGADGPSRRTVLAACGAGLAALAGCATVDLGGRDEGREFDADRLAAVVRAGVPTPPDAFPVAITPAMVDRHRDRARDLLSAVPETPDVPNGEVARRLSNEREQVVDALDAGAREGTTALSRLDHARHVRHDAAEVAGVYRASTRAVDRAAAADRRASLREDRLTFEADWTYRGGDPAVALAVHAELEDRHRSARRHAEAWPPFPDDPAADVFRVGEILRDLEAGEAALGDARRLRARYLDGVADPTGHLEAFTAAAHGVHDHGRHKARRLDDLPEDPDRDAELPFDRSLEGGPARELYRVGRVNAAREIGREAARHRRAGEHATATVSAVRWLAGLRAFEAVLEALEAGEYGPPARAGRVAAEREAAVEALEAAWSTAPVPVSAAVTWPARESIDHAVYDLGNAADPDDVDEALARLGYARLYAEAVPPAVGTAVELLERYR